MLLLQHQPHCVWLCRATGSAGSFKQRLGGQWVATPTEAAPGWPRPVRRSQADVNSWISSATRHSAVSQPPAAEAKLGSPEERDPARRDLGAARALARDEGPLRTHRLSGRLRPATPRPRPPSRAAAARGDLPRDQGPSLKEDQPARSPSATAAGGITCGGPSRASSTASGAAGPSGPTTLARP